MHLYYISSMSKHVHIDGKNDMVNEYNNNIYHRTIKMKPVDVKPITYNDAGVENNKKNPKFGWSCKNMKM